MRRKSTIAAMTAVFLAVQLASAAAFPPAPPETRADFKFGELNQDTLKALMALGTLEVVRTRPDHRLINVTTGAVVSAPINLVFATITDYPNYPRFMPQTSRMDIIDKQGNRTLVEQTISVKVWKLPTVDTVYQLVQEAAPPNKVRFWHAAGDLPGTWGGWDLVASGDQTLIFYSLYSNLTALGYGIGSVMEAEPDFMIGVNMTTAMMVTKAVKVECEKRARANK